MQGKERLLLATIEQLESQLAAVQSDQNFYEINESLQSNKIELENIYAFQAQGAYIRAKARYKIEGEKPSRLFCSLEKHNAVQKHIPKLIVEKNDKKIEVTDQISIENEIYDYYKKLFAHKSTENYDIENFVTPEVSNSCP